MANRNKHGWEIRLKKKGDDELLFYVKGLRWIIHFPVASILTFVCWICEYFLIILLNIKDILMIKLVFFFLMEVVSRNIIL